MIEIVINGTAYACTEKTTANALKKMVGIPKEDWLAWVMRPHDYVKDTKCKCVHCTLKGFYAAPCCVWAQDRNIRIQPQDGDEFVIESRYWFYHFMERTTLKWVDLGRQVDDVLGRVTIACECPRFVKNMMINVTHSDDCKAGTKGTEKIRAYVE